MRIRSTVCALLVGWLVVPALGANSIILSNVHSSFVVSDAASWTVATLSSASAGSAGMTVNVGFDWNMYNVVNPGGEIDQLFVALGHQQVLQPIVYHGHPGGQPGVSSHFSQSFDLTGLPLGNYDLVVARMAAFTPEQGIADYLSTGGGWTGKLADLAVVPEPCTALLLGLSCLLVGKRAG